MAITAKKSLGQHFLNSKHVLDQIITSADVKAGENVLEIGPGMGVLTEALLKAGAKVTAVEMDARALDFLSISPTLKPFIDSGQLKLVAGDILKYKVALKNYALVANIPYYITGAILEKFLENEPRPDRMVLLVQKEVAERIVAHDGKESVLSVSVKAFGKPSIVAKVARGAFTPPPTVESAILKITDIKTGKAVINGLNTGLFFKIVKAGFAHKRKFLVRNLEDVLPAEKLFAIWLVLGLDQKVRAEDLTVDQWVEIAKESI